MHWCSVRVEVQVVPRAKGEKRDSTTAVFTLARAVDSTLYRVNILIYYYITCFTSQIPTPPVARVVTLPND